MTRRAWTATLALAVTMVAVAGACDSGGDAGATGSFLEDANAICEERAAQVEELAEPDDLGGWGELAADVQQINEEALGRLRALEVPEGQADDAEGLWQMIEAQNVDLSQVESAARMGEQEAAEAILARMEERRAAFDELAADLGLVACGEGVGSAEAHQAAGDPTAVADEGALLDEATTVIEEYLDANWAVDPTRMEAVSAHWALRFAELDEIAEMTQAIPTIEAVPAEIDSALTGLEELSGGWLVEGEVVVQAQGTTYTYRDFVLVRDDDGDLVLVDFCRSSDDGMGPLEGCASDAVGMVGESLTSQDGAVTVSVGPFNRTLGAGPQTTSFAVYVQNQSSSEMRVMGGTALSYVVEDPVSGAVEAATTPASAVDGVDVAPPGSTATGIVLFGTPDLPDGSDLPPGTLTLTVTDDAGTEHRFRFEVPGLPEDA